MKIVAMPVEAIALFKEKENPTPYKFRYQTKEGGYQEIRVDKVISVEERRIAGVKAFVYVCQSQVEGEIKRYELKYIVAEYRWELYKI